MARLYGLIGYPLSHSLSRHYFVDKFTRAALPDVDYRLFPLRSIEELPLLLQSNPDITGFNVTSPYKQAVIPYLHALSSVADQIGSVNAVKVDRGAGRIFLTGHNTDYLGFEKSLSSLVADFSFTALILGTGGAAQAVAFALKRLGVACRFVSRFPLNDHILSYSQLSPEVVSACKLIVNATPAGMYCVTGEVQFPYHLLTPQHILYDLIYSPEETLFLRQGRLRGCATKNGLEMLYLQADESWLFWNE